MTAGWQSLVGTVVQGYRVASGLSDTTPYPQGTLAMQLPHFLARGFDLQPYFLGTLNVAIAPLQFRLVEPEVTLEQVAWTDLHGPESFSFARCRLGWGNATHSGWLYYPHPETKPMHRQRSDVLELLMPKLAGIGYGDRVRLAIRPTEIHLIER